MQRADFLPLSGNTIHDYIDHYLIVDDLYYNNERYQRKIGVLTPIEKQNYYLLAA